MDKKFKNILRGYEQFRDKYVHHDASIMQQLADHGQQPQIMVIACCDSRVDPALILQCEPGDLFVVRNVANIVPPYEKDEMHHGTSAALEFAVCFLKVKHIIIFGHSQCGGIQALIREKDLHQNDFITNWVSIVKTKGYERYEPDEYAKIGLQQSYHNCMTFPWLEEKVVKGKLTIHRWYFDIKSGEIFTYSDIAGEYQPLALSNLI